MILADTSIWVDHLRRRNAAFAQLLEAVEVLGHPFVVGELALGHLDPRAPLLRDLRDLPQSIVASHQEVLHFINEYRLFGRGIGYVDVHLLAATRLTRGAALWTRDQQLRRVADRLKLAASF
ncbi:MAG: PIN domain-containing protein [Xanthobacteraceae bacterium]